MRHFQTDKRCVTEINPRCRTVQSLLCMATETMQQRTLNPGEYTTPAQSKPSLLASLSSGSDNAAWLKGLQAGLWAGIFLIWRWQELEITIQTRCTQNIALQGLRSSQPPFWDVALGIGHDNHTAAVGQKTSDGARTNTAVQGKEAAALTDG